MKTALLKSAALSAIAASAVFLQTTAVKAQVAVDSLSIGGNFGFVFDNAFFLAPTFTTGPSQVQFDEITLSLVRLGFGEDFNLALYDLDASFFPDNELASVSLTASGVTANFQDFSFDMMELGDVGDFILQADTGYGLVLSSDAGSGPFVLENNSGATNQYTFAEGFSSAGDGYYFSFDSGQNWFSTGYTPIIQIKVKDPVTSSVPGPLPLFGAAAAFGYSRRLRRRIKAAD